MKWLNRLFRRKKAKLPGSMTDLRRGDPCWCGSGRRYARCHRREDRQRMRELGLDPKRFRRNPFL